MSLSRPHPLLSSAGSSPSKVSMASVQALMLSGRYRTQSLMRHWHKYAKSNCLLSSQCLLEDENIPHVLQLCPALNTTRDKLLNFTQNYCSNLPDIMSKLILKLCHPSSSEFCLFLLDCSALPEVISFAQIYGSGSLVPFFDISRMWIFVLHRERLKRLGRWKPGGILNSEKWKTTAA